jgi:hypothetical protein
MAKRTGKMVILLLARQICRKVGRYGTSGVVAFTGSAALGTALEAVRVACMAWEAGDNYPGEVDDVAPDGPEDVGGGGGGGGPF